MGDPKRGILKRVTFSVTQTWLVKCCSGRIPLFGLLVVLAVLTHPSLEYSITLCWYQLNLLCYFTVKWLVRSISRDMIDHWSADLTASSWVLFRSQWCVLVCVPVCVLVCALVCVCWCVRWCVCAGVSGHLVQRVIAGPHSDDEIPLLVVAINLHIHRHRCSIW